MGNFRVRGDGGLPGWGCPGEHVLGAFVEQELPGDERKRLEQHLARCQACRSQVSFLVRTQQQQVAEIVPAGWLVKARNLGSSGATRWAVNWTWAGAAAAIACLVLGVALWLTRPPSRTPSSPVASHPRPPEAVAQAESKPLIAPSRAPVVRNGVHAVPRAEIFSPKPDSVATPDNLEFRWKEVEGATGYELRLVSAEGDVLWEERLQGHSAKVPPQVVLQPGETYFAWVRVYLPEGNVLKSRAVRFRIAREE